MVDFSTLQSYSTGALTGLETFIQSLPKICFKDIITPKQVSIFINFFLHIVILSIVLYIFIMVVIDKIVSNTLNEIYTDISKSILIDPLVSNPITYAYLKEGINYNTIRKLYNKPDPFSTNVNGILYASIGTIITILFLQLVLNIVLTRFMACYDYSILHLFFENFVIFLFVGGFEFVFFWFIGKLYVPVLPSYILIKGLDKVISLFTI